MMKRLRALALAVAAGGLALACEDTEIGRVDGRVVTEAEVNFGRVQVGLTAERALKVTNDGRGRVSIVAIEPGEDFGAAGYQFGVDDSPLDLGPSQQATVRVTFQPLAATDAPVTSSFVIRTDAQAAAARTVTVTVIGQGVESGLRVEPNPMDFGNVLIGTSAQMSLVITNDLGEAVSLRTNGHRAGRPEVNRRSGLGRFDLDLAVQPDGSLLPPNTRLEPGASLTIVVTYVPDPAGAGQLDRSEWVITNCDFTLCEVKVTFTGRGTDAALACTPASVDFGTVNPGATLMRDVTCENVASDAIQISDWYTEAGAAPEFMAAASSPMTLAPGATVTIPVAFSPTQATFSAGLPVEGAIIVETSNPGAGQLSPVRVALLGRAGGPTIRVTPSSLRFGNLAVDTYIDRLLLVENVGYEDLIITNIDGDADGAGGYSVDTSSARLAVGSSTVVVVTFAPTAPGPHVSAVAFHSNDALDPVLRVPLDSQAEALPPCEYVVEPVNVNFGAVFFQQTDVRPVRIRNIGPHDCLVNDLMINRAAPTATTAFSLVAGPETGLRIAGGAFHEVSVLYAPASTIADRAQLDFYVSDPRAPNVAVPLFGVGRSITEVTCPPPVTATAGAPVTITATGMSFGANITGYAWSVLTTPILPGGGMAPVTWAPNPPNAPTVQFTAFIVGTYQVQVTVTDDLGRNASCTTAVEVQGDGLQVTLTWDGSGDVDLHVHNGNNTPWFSAGGADDCFYANRTPIWDALLPMSIGPNPELDFDNTSGFGPENTRLQTPITGQTYTIGVHNYSSSAGRIPTIDIYCGGSIPVATLQGAPLNGNTGGNCTANDFWKVATVTFTGAGMCTVTPLNVVVPASAACIAF